jgi:hypothetical protein
VPSSLGQSIALAHEKIGGKPTARVILDCQGAFKNGELAQGAARDSVGAEGHRLSRLPILQGRALRYYAKQLAQHSVMTATTLPIVANEIEVL